MVKIKIEVGRQLYFLIIGFVILSVLAVGTWAFNSAAPSAMGHSLDEIEGLEDYVKAIVNNSQGGVAIPEICQLIHSTRNDYEIKDLYTVNLPSKCSSVQGCEMIFRVYYKGFDLKYQHSLKFTQTWAGIGPNQHVELQKWSTSDSDTLNVNGPIDLDPQTFAPLGVVSTSIFSYNGNMQVLDDYITTTPKETESTKIVVKDGSATDAFEFYIC